MLHKNLNFGQLSSHNLLVISFKQSQLLADDLVNKIMNTSIRFFFLTLLLWIFLCICLLLDICVFLVCALQVFFIILFHQWDILGIGSIFQFVNWDVDTSDLDTFDLDMVLSLLLNFLGNGSLDVSYEGLALSFQGPIGQD